MRRTWLVLAVVAVLALAGVGVLLLLDRETYQLKVLMPVADGTYAGGKVMIQGHQVGQIAKVEVRQDKALVTADVDDSAAPLHAGTRARISWESVIGARVLELLPAPASNPVLPSGKMIESTTERVELDDVLAALDPPTRERVQGLVGNLRQTLSGREQDLNATVKTAGPTVEALGEVLRAVGDDGPAIRDLITRLREMIGELTQRDGDLGKTVGDLGTFTASTAQKQQQLKAALGELPSTVDEATKTLDGVPAASDATVPLLQELRGPAQRLPSMAHNLSPVLSELRPTVATLRPTLDAAQSLLRYTPGLLDNAHATLPGIDQAVRQLQPAVGFLRPYTPELTGWVSNWTEVFASQVNSGNYARALIVESASSANENPGIVPPGLTQTPRPAPGSIAGQPWTDANGDGMR